MRVVRSDCATSSGKIQHGPVELSFFRGPTDQTGDGTVGRSRRPTVDRMRPSAGDEGLPLGAVIPGSQYRVHHEARRGGMGSVYAAEHVGAGETGRPQGAALRTPPTRRDAIDRLRDEARAASRIGSEFICDVTDFGQMPDGRVFLVMEYLDGPSLGPGAAQRGRR